ncbi:hypothetical protein B0T17DRAFT_510246 [Bombardia bombarda]|uniref:Uncharacterized protein n=1 Tax=Bombardia bombarda TaxID=252184 RepID=A0AA39WHT4_9PEZI|nr:hypothetical protein B0T17DRAFT_510246 [Bombardia bombarda]
MAEGRMDSLLSADDKHQTELTTRFMLRFEELGEESDEMIANRDASVKNVTFTRDLVLGEMSLEEASQSKHQAKVGAFIGPAALLYLPMTTVATVFAMPIFDFKANWWDLHFNPANSSDTTLNSIGSDSGPMQGPPPPIISGYFWIYLGISGFLTIATLSWWFLAKFVHSKSQKRNGRSLRSSHKFFRWESWGEESDTSSNSMKKGRYDPEWRADRYEKEDPYKSNDLGRRMGRWIKSLFRRKRALNAAENLV